MPEIDDILKISSPEEFADAAMEVFRRQAGVSGDGGMCPPYCEYLEAAGISPEMVTRPEEIPYLPIELFKTQRVYCGAEEPETVFASSGTGESGRSRHYVARLADYRRVYLRGFEIFYARPENYTIYALLPGYLENKNSSLIEMVRGLGGRFYLYDHDKLLRDMALDDGPKILLGVSYALLDLAEELRARGEKLPGGPTGATTVVETGGMKGRREEISKAQMHDILGRAFGVGKIHSEYGMAELMSQAWSSDGGVFRTPPWMRISVRDLSDPFDVRMSGTGDRGDVCGLRGGINIIDLANLYSCAFIQTQDVGTLFPDGSFTIDGRVARSDIRGCNLLVQ